MNSTPAEQNSVKAGYRALFQMPGVASILAVTTAGKLAAGLVPFGLVAVFSSRGEYGAGGTAFALALVVGSLAAPFWARMVDRHSAVRTLPPLAVVRTTLYCLAAALGTSGYVIAALTLVVLAAACASPGQALVRTIWTSLTPPGDQRRRLHSLDSILEETLFIVTPLLTALIWATIGPAWAVVIGSLTGAVGILMVIPVGWRHPDIWAILTRSGSPRGREFRERRRPMILGRAPLAVMSPMAGLGFIMGGVAAALPAWAALRYSAELSGVLLAVISGAGVAGGLIYGKAKLRGSLWLHYMMMGLVVGVGAIVLALSDHLGVALPATLLLGVGMTPMFVVAYLLVDQAFPKQRQTEANATVGASYDLAAGTGAVVAGFTASVLNPNSAFAVVGCVGAVLALAAVTQLRRSDDVMSAEAV